jgi:hypothetical protein
MTTKAYVPPQFGSAAVVAIGSVKVSVCKALDPVVAKALGADPRSTLTSKEFDFGAVVLKSGDGMIDLGRVERANVSVTQVTNPNGTLRAWFTVDAATTSLGWHTQVTRPIWRWSFRNSAGDELISADIDSFEGNPLYPFEGFRMECGWDAFGTFAVHYLPTGPWFDALAKLSYLVNGTFYKCP